MGMARTPSTAESRSTRKHKAILNAATAIFLEKGYDGTSMDDVATRAAVSKPTVYKHFSDKSRLYAEVVRATTDEMDEFVAAIANSLMQEKNVERALTDLARGLLTALMQPRIIRLRSMVIANAGNFPEVGRSWYELGFGRVLATLAKWFEHLASRKALRMEDSMLAANHFVGLLLWIPVNQAMYTGGRTQYSPGDLDRYAASAVRAFLQGYAAKSRA